MAKKKLGIESPIKEKLAINLSIKRFAFFAASIPKGITKNQVNIKLDKESINVLNNLWEIILDTDAL
jgi:hypothetical protein